MEEKLKYLRLLFIAWFILVIIMSIIKCCWIMKELSIQEKATRYDEALKEAVELISDLADELEYKIAVEG